MFCHHFPTTDRTGAHPKPSAVDGWNRSKPIDNGIFSTYELLISQPSTVDPHILILDSYVLPPMNWFLGFLPICWSILRSLTQMATFSTFFNHRQWLVWPWTGTQHLQGTSKSGCGFCCERQRFHPPAQTGGITMARWHDQTPPGFLQDLHFRPRLRPGVL